jgi:hypothetical protein
VSTFDHRLQLREVAEAVNETMQTIRADVAAGNGAAIEADAVLLIVAYAIVDKLGLGAQAREEFLEACDLAELIPEEAFRR